MKISSYFSSDAFFQSSSFLLKTVDTLSSISMSAVLLFWTNRDQDDDAAQDATGADQSEAKGRKKTKKKKHSKQTSTCDTFSS